MIVSNDFGTRLKELRKQTGMTQKELADKLGVTKSVVSFYELRERAPSPEILVKLTSIFDVTSDYLWVSIGSNVLTSLAWMQMMNVLFS